MVRFTLQKIAVCVLLVFATLAVNAQTTSDAVMMKPGQICVGLMYNHSAWDHYWEGDSLRDNGNIGMLTTHMIGGGFVLGIINRVNVYVSLPYVSTNPSGGVVEGSKGFQDLFLAAKVDAFEKKLGPGKLSLLASAAFTTPVSNYIPEAPFAIGLGCPDGLFRGIIQYGLENPGIYLRLQGGYSLRGYTYLQREYYYTEEGYYTDQVDMPNGVDYSATIGYETKDKTFKAEADYEIFNCLGGFDIRRQDGGFPSNEMDFTTIGAKAEYYLPVCNRHFRIDAFGSYVLDGRNVGQAMSYGVQLNYFFNLWNKGEKTSSDSATPTDK